jgi:hypothetical protein
LFSRKYNRVLSKEERDIVRTPPMLYKYVGVEGKRLNWLTESIANSTLYFSTRDELNDPYELGVYPSFRATTSEVRQWCADNINSAHFSETFYEERVAELLEAARNPAQAEFEAQKLFRTWDETTAILSLTETPDNLVMWPNYADGHRGCCLMLDTSIHTMAAFPDLPVPYPLKVSYRSKMPRFRFFLTGEREYSRLSLGTKTKAMDYEREWRLIHPTLKGIVSAPKQMITGVIFGARTSDKVQKRVVQACRRAEYPILLYVAVLSRGKYSLDFEVVVV